MEHTDNLIEYLRGLADDYEGQGEHFRFGKMDAIKIRAAANELEKRCITADALKALEDIARKNIPPLENRQDLEPHNSDSEDFYDISVWCLKDALVAAYELGKAAGGQNAERKMNAEQKQAYEWAKNQDYQSVAARYAKTLAGLVDELTSKQEG